MTGPAIGEADCPAQAYARFWQDLTVDGLDRMEAVFAPDIHFRDPFNDVRGRDKLRAILDHMFTATDRPRFTVTDIAESDRAAYLRWDFTFEIRGRPLRIEGVSEVRFGVDGLAVEHIDHWDAAAQFYERLPVLGGLLRAIRRRMEV